MDQNMGYLTRICIIVASLICIYLHYVFFVQHLFTVILLLQIKLFAHPITIIVICTCHISGSLFNRPLKIFHYLLVRIYQKLIIQPKFELLTSQHSQVHT